MSQSRLLRVAAHRIQTVEAAALKIRAYHGSTHKIDKFDLSQVDNPAANHEQGPGLYFTTEEKDALNYAKGNGYLYTVDIRIVKQLSRTKPFEYTALERLINKAPDLADTLSNWDESPSRAKNMLINSLLDESKHEAYQTLWHDVYGGESKALIQRLIVWGYDGVVIPKNIGSHILVINPARIKVVEVTKIG